MTWEAVGPLPSSDINRMFSHPYVHDYLILLMHWGGLQISLDGGRTWTRSDAGIPRGYTLARRRARHARWAESAVPFYRSGKLIDLVGGAGWRRGFCQQRQRAYLARCHGRSGRHVDFIVRP